MRRFGAAVIGAVVATSFCLATVRAVDALGVGVRYPAYAGEEDFSLRIAWFLLLELPGFALLGAWLGNLALRGRRAAALGGGGMVAGTLAAFLAQAGLARRIEALPDSTAANAAAVLFLLLWLTLAVGGAVLGVRRAAPAAPGPKRPRGEP